MDAVRAQGFDDLLRERVDAGVPVLGLCLGMQLLFERSTELGGADGLGLLQGDVKGLETGGLKVPQIGWNRVAWRGSSELTKGLPPLTPMYHVHSFAARPKDSEDVLGTAHYGSEFVTAVNRGNVYGVQFHPEKSGPHGLQLLENFASAVAVAA
jgi:glutamine amidotransferase